MAVRQDWVSLAAAVARLHRELPSELRELELQPEARQAADSAAAAKEDWVRGLREDGAHQACHWRRAEPLRWAAP